MLNTMTTENQHLSMPEGCPPQLSITFLESKLKSLMKLAAPPKLAAIKRIDADAGMVSFIFQIEFSSEELRHQYPAGVVLKLPTILKLPRVLEQTEDQSTAIVAKIHNIECYAYENLPMSEIGMPPCVTTQKMTNDTTGALLFEAFEKPVFMPDMVKGLSMPQARQVLSGIAALHAFGIKSGLDGHRNAIEVGLAVMSANFPSFLEKSLQVWQQFSRIPISDNDMDKLKFLSSPSRWANFAQNCRFQNLCHGDLWANNMLLFGDLAHASDTDHLAAILDWQGLHIGSIGEDISRLLTHNTCHKTVDEHFDELLNHYYAELCKNCSPPFEIDYVYSEVQKHWAYGSLLTLFQATIWRMNIQRNLDVADDDRLNRFYVRINVNLKKSIEYMTSEEAQVNG